MKQLSGIIKIVGVVTKYVAIAVAISKALQVLNDELKKIDLTDDSKPEQNEPK